MNDPIFIPEPEAIRDSKTCISNIESIIQGINQLPVCYNQMMLKGALQYCLLALRKLYNMHGQSIIDKCCDYVHQVERLYNEQNQCGSSSFMRLNLQQIEGKFELIEIECERIGLLPKLDDFTF